MNKSGNGKGKANKRLLTIGIICHLQETYKACIVVNAPAKLVIEASATKFDF